MRYVNAVHSTLIVCAGMSFALVASAGEGVDKTLPAAANGYVKIVITRGEVDITGWDRDEVHIEGELDDLAEGLVFVMEGDRTRIEVKLPRRNVNWGGGSDLDIRVPMNSKIDFDGVSTDTTIGMVSGGVRVRTVSGDITASEIQNQVRINTVSGNIDVSASSGDTHISTVSGEIHLDMNSSRIVLNSVSGEIEAQFEEFTQLRANVVSGDIEVSGKLAGEGKIEIASVSGDISLELEGPVNAHLSAEVGPGGDIDNSVSDDEPVNKFPGRKKLEVQFGDGSGQINLRTVTGDIRIDDRS